MMLGSHSNSGANDLEKHNGTGPSRSDHPASDNRFVGSSDDETKVSATLESDDSLLNKSERQFSVVGIGASAGGLEALEQFFDNMPPDSGMAFVVVQHLSPDFKSVMDELLARHTKMPIHRVEDSMEVEPNAIYLIPSKKEMIISGGKLFLSDKDPEQGLTLPIDIFFRSLAQDFGPRAIGIILSGTGSDGARGICSIHEEGGFVIAQDVNTAKFDGMPKNAIETNVVDLVLSPEQMASSLLSYTNHPAAGNLPNMLPIDPALLEGFDAIFQLLRKRFDIDFSYYKRPTVTRRVQRRLQMNQITNLDDYVERLRNDPHELNLLYKDLLIGVTNFFRDAEAFQILEERVLPQILEKLKPESELRLWVAGCATGEEAYSLAILVQEQLKSLPVSPTVKIFATDVHRASLDFASAGVYCEASLTAVSPERLERFFTKVKGGYRVSQELRQMIVFAPHNLIKDAPFTKIDLISCRNLLIYFEPPAQKKVISLFHFALKKGGIMFMGPSESPGELADEFDQISDRWKVYAKCRDRRLPPDMRLPLSAGFSYPTTRRELSVLSPHRATPDVPLLRAYDELLKEYSPPSLLINNRRELVQSFSGASEYLKLRDGRPSHDVFEIVLPELKIPLTTAVQQASKKHAPISVPGVRVTLPEGEKTITILVKPLVDRESDRDHYLVCLETAHKPASTVTEQGEILNVDLASNEQLQALEQELVYTKENLQATVEEMETSNEELQAANEELVASNEELQSTNEELHSVNEELYTVNAEYQKKIAELTELTADMNNLLHSTEVGVIFLDCDFCIRKYTPKIGEIFHLIPLDIGRCIDSFAHNIRGLDLLNSLREVLETEQTKETEVRIDDDQTYLLRILPYWSKSKVDGIVLTLININYLRKTESQLRLMSKIFVEGADAMVIEDLQGNIQDVNAETERMFGWSREDLIGKNIEVLVPPEERLRAKELRSRCLELGGVRNIEMIKQNRQGEAIPVLLTLSLLKDDQGSPHAITSSPKDISALKRAEESARTAVRNRDQFLAMLSHELRNPLGAALNAAYVLERETEHQLPPAMAEACRIVKNQTLQVARLLDDLLDVARVTQGKIEVRSQLVDLCGLVDDAVQAVHSLMDSRDHKLSVSIPSSPLYVQGDPARLLQILENLLTNAAKYTASDGRIQLSLAKEDGEAVIRVKDNGMGIPADMLERIFELFVQSDDTLSRSQGGMGLGLTLVRTLVSLHGGHVSAHSAGIGKGSEFVVRFKLAAASDSVSRSSEAHGEVSAGVKPRHIVLVEDNRDSRTMLAALLKMEGHQVSTAEEGRQGLEMILHQRPEVAIIDIGLPELSGYDIAQQIRQKMGREIFLIALTGYGRNEDRDATRKAGFDTHLVKPLNPLELAKILNSELTSTASQ